MKRTKKYYFQLLWLWCTDIALMCTSFVVAYQIRFSPLMPTPLGRPPLNIYLEVLPFCVFIYFLVLRFYGAYRLGRHSSLPEEFFVIFKSVLMGSVILMAGSFVYREFSYSRTMLILSAVIIIGFLFINRIMFKFLESRIAKIRGVQRRVLLIGRGPAIRSLITGLTKNRKGFYAIKGVLSQEQDHVGTHVNEVSIIGTVDELEAVLEKHKDIDEVILGENDLPRSRVLQMILKCEEYMIDFKMVSDMLGLMTRSLDIENVNGVSLVGVSETPLHRPINRFMKRLVDILGSLVALALFSPIMLIAGLLIKLSDGGPMIFSQERVGEDAELFNIYKFRSMKVNAESESGPQFATDDDPRKTRLGDFLRKSSIDELPQLFNVLKGNMSLVGPRPERPVFVDQLKTDIPRYMARHKVLTGITGWAQVNGLRGGPPSEERIKYDLFYIENWSIWLDIKIILMTPFSFKGAK